MCSKTKHVNISAFLDEGGRIKQIPSPNRTKIPVLEHLAEKFEKNRFYNEKEVNEVINRWHTFGDYFILRRLLVDHNLLERTIDGAKYWVADREVKE